MRALILSFLLLLPSALHAATLYLVRDDSGGNRAAIVLDTEGASINAIEGVLQVSDARIYEGSAISLWLERPRLVEGELRFSGVTPGGIPNGATVFSVEIAQDAPIEISEALAYLNDGEGTPITVRLASRTQPLESSEKDVREPESFAITRVSDPTLFEGRSFIVFGTLDKQSGIEQYEVCDGILLRCARAESPHFLTRGSWLVRVRAYDREGNVREEKLFTLSGLVIAVALLLFGILFGVRAIYRRHLIAF